MAIITVSRGSKSGGVEFAECLAHCLGFASLSHEVTTQAAENLGIPEELLLGKIQKGAGAWERLTTNRRLYVIAVQSALADACIAGDLVYHGYAGHMLLKGIPTVFKVRLIAPMDMRIRTVMGELGLSYEDARYYIHYVDQERVSWTKFVFGVDWHDPANYDVVINLADMSIDTACALVGAVAQLPAYQSTEPVRKKLRDFALACRVKLALAKHPAFRAAQFQVTADDGKVEILGESGSADFLLKQAGPNEHEVQLVAESVMGVQTVTVDLRRFADIAEA
ncbi:MAG TPA: cytidylate kinase-like family protein [Terriglobales bacterium]|nr:cytidylate kinase-like family protein [Terriglobales bacterium]